MFWCAALGQDMKNRRGVCTKHSFLRHWKSQQGMVGGVFARALPICTRGTATSFQTGFRRGGGYSSCRCWIWCVLYASARIWWVFVMLTQKSSTWSRIGINLEVHFRCQFFLHVSSPWHFSDYVMRPKDIRRYWECPQASRAGGQW